MVASVCSGVCVVLTKHLIGVHPLPELESAFNGNTVALSTARLAE